MDVAPVIWLVGLSAIGLHAIGSEAVEHRRLIRSGQLAPMREADYENYGGTVAEDLVTFGIALAAAGVVLSQTWPMIDQVRGALPT
jgi:hypothetical protein